MNEGERLCLAVVAAVAPGGVKLRFEGEAEPTGKYYPVVKGLSAAVGERAVCARIGGGWLVLAVL